MPPHDRKRCEWQNNPKLTSANKEGKPSHQLLTSVDVCVGCLYFDGLSWQHGHFCPCLLDKLLEVDLSQLFSQLLQFLFFVLDGNDCFQTYRHHQLGEDVLVTTRLLLGVTAGDLPPLKSSVTDGNPLHGMGQRTASSICPLKCDAFLWDGASRLGSQKVVQTKRGLSQWRSSAPHWPTPPG